MHNMKYDEMEMKNFSTPSPDISKYPSGLRIRLGPEEIEKLGIQDVPDINKKFKLEAIVEVVEVESERDSGDENKYNISLQIVEMNLDDENKKSDGMVQTIYGA